MDLVRAPSPLPFVARACRHTWKVERTWWKSGPHHPPVNLTWTASTLFPCSPVCACAGCSSLKLENELVSPPQLHLDCVHTFPCSQLCAYAGMLKFEWENERRCDFTAIEVSGSCAG
eukprot:235712-Chlamydomonas_euryale.AAC.1